MIVGNKIKIFYQLDSTNNYAKKLLQNNRLPEGYTVWSFYQTHGRGLGQNTWQSNYRQNIMCSIILYPSKIQLSEQFILSKAISLGVTDCLSYYLSSPKIKWPNDIYYDSKKIGGILIENSVNNNTIQYSIIGIGLNINQITFHQNNAPFPTSLRSIIGAKCNLAKILRELLKAIDIRYNQLLMDDYSTIDNNYLDLLYNYQSFSTYKVNDIQFLAKIIDVKRDGALELLTDTGTRHLYYMKDIEFV